MKISIQSIDFTARQELLDLVNDKLSKIERFSDRVQEAKVVLRVEKSESRENKIFEVKLIIPGNDIFVKKNAETFEDGLQKVIDVLQREIKDWKEKQR
jgi:putative sigma-54 modulation protein